MNWSQKLNVNRQTIRGKIIRDPYYRFQSLEEINIAAELGIKIEVSQANIDDWLRLPGISIHQARSLVELAGMGIQFLCVEDIATAINIPVQRLKPLTPILSFTYDDIDSFLTPQRINLNKASFADLEQIPFLEPDLAKLIIDNRQQEGVYRSLADFQRRLMLNGQLVSQLMYYLQF